MGWFERERLASQRANWNSILIPLHIILNAQSTERGIALYAILRTDQYILADHAYQFLIDFIHFFIVFIIILEKKHSFWSDVAREFHYLFLILVNYWIFIDWRTQLHEIILLMGRDQIMIFINLLFNLWRFFFTFSIIYNYISATGSELRGIKYFLLFYLYLLLLVVFVNSFLAYLSLKISF